MDDKALLRRGVDLRPGRSVRAKAAVRRGAALSGRQWWVLGNTVVLLPLVAAAVRVVGVRRATQLLARWLHGPGQVSNLALAREVGDAVNLAARLSRGPSSTCLYRSLVTWHLLRRRSIDAVVIIGVRLDDEKGFMAHAWVEVDGIPVNDKPDIAQQFSPFPSFLP